MKESDKQILKSIAPLLILIMLFFIAGKFSLSQVKSLRSQIKNTEKTQSVLSDKLKTLRSVSQLSTDQKNIALAAMPKTNPALSVISQIRILAAETSLTVENIKSSSIEDATGGLSYTTTSFDLLGPRSAILTFVEKLGKMAPLTYIEKVDISENFGTDEVSVYTKTYYAALPETIPMATEAVSDLTSTEKEMLTQMLSLSQPVINENVIASASAINATPFGD